MIRKRKMEGKKSITVDISMPQYVMLKKLSAVTGLSYAAIIRQYLSFLSKKTHKYKHILNRDCKSNEFDLDLSDHDAT